MKSYLELLEQIKTHGVEKPSARNKMPPTVGLSFGHIQHNLQDGFPLLTTKQMYWKGIVHELLWFLRGETNIKYLVDNKVNIWNQDAYRWYLKNTCHNEPMSLETFITWVKENKEDFTKSHGVNYNMGDLGKVYGYQWRNQNGVDQVKDIFEGVKDNPFSRYHIIDGWNKKDFSEMALPPCHLLYQFITRPLTDMERVKLYDNSTFDSSSSTTKQQLGSFIYPEEYVQKFEDDVPDPIGWQLSKKEHEFLDEQKIPRLALDLNMYQRSVDTALGLPFNIASMSLLLLLFSKVFKMHGGVINWIGGDTHLYCNHLEKVDLQLSRTPHKLPKMVIKKDLNSLEDILQLSIEDFDLQGYISYDKIDYELSTGL